MEIQQMTQNNNKETATSGVNIDVTFSDEKNSISCRYEYINDEITDIYYKSPITGEFREISTGKGFIFQSEPENKEYEQLYTCIRSGAYDGYTECLDASDIGRTIEIAGTSTIVKVDDVEAI